MTNPLRGLGRLTWYEIKIFMREPLGAIGTIFIPVLVFVVAGRASTGVSVPPSDNFSRLLGPGGIPTLVAISVTVGAVLSLANIIAIYREGGILKRLRATPLRPWTILSAHVIVKLLLTALTMTLMVLAGRRYFAIGPEVPMARFTIALLISTLGILSLGFIIASIIPTARFAQPIGAVVFYPMIGFSGLFFPIASLSPGLRVLARILPLGYSASLLQGIWQGDTWSSHSIDISALTLVFVVGVAVTSRVFRWE